MKNKQNTINSRLIDRVDEVTSNDIFNLQQDNSFLSESIPASKLQWNAASPEQLEFMQQVYNYHVKSSAKKRPFVNDIPAAELAVIEGGHRAKISAAQSCRDLLAAARAALEQQQQAQVEQALSVKNITLISAYRSASQQFTIWQRNFPNYYRETASKRAGLSGGEHGQKAVAYLAGYISSLVAAPGYSLHNNGLAVDLGTRDKGVNLGASKSQRQPWRQSWLFGWLTVNASQFNYYQNTSIDEPWHWEYRETTPQPSQSEFNEFWEFGSAQQNLLEPAPVDDERFSQEYFEQQESAVLNLPVHTVIDQNALQRSDPPELRSLSSRIPQYTRVRIEQIEGNYARVSGVDGTAYGWTALVNLGTYYKDFQRLQSASLSPSTPLSISANWSSLKRTLASTYNRLGGLMNVLATELNIPQAALLAVWQVESGGRTHVPNQAVIRFENHLLFRQWGQNNQQIYDRHFQHGGHNGISGRPWQNHKFRENPSDAFQGFHGDQAREYQVLALASRLATEEIALQCISIGGPQILGSNYRMIGYTTPREMYDAFQSGERPQVLGFFDFCQYKLGHGSNRGALIRHLAALNWEEFTRGYNGNGQVATYSANLRQAYQAATEIFTLTPPASQSLRDFSGGKSVAIAEGRDELTNVPLLTGHRGTPPDLILRWNEMTVRPTSIDVVVHLHGYSSDRLRMVISRTKEPNSGFVNPSNPGDLSLGRHRPTLAILPRGNYFGGASGNGYNFPALITPTGLTELIEFSLQHFARGFGLGNLQVGRLIITAHSGGGAPLMQILLHNDPHEVHVFDALYQDAHNLIRWAQNRIRRDQTVLETPMSQDAQQYMQQQGGALRVFYKASTPTESYSLTVHQALMAALPNAPSPAALLSNWYRVQKTTIAHGDIPRRYGFQLLGNAAALLPDAYPQ
ncbi:M15 family metallopeptidase [Desmonostoc muscorum LEGE 12446]|uniref:DUF3380 domain-containing protein n=1 Tax=Desmonostoc muscorum LEGE 12446 TaxID=1828758 RepID=A0A8J7ABG1_DESMC|nr:N-acetylmuramidase domain-containing protein [Desmonostoc muscorum]MCF2146268.1 M15 family metallopeptidase [Desmonostoc muscorum LEGE 12446]